MLNLYRTSIHPPRPTHNNHLDTGGYGVTGVGHGCGDTNMKSIKALASESGVAAHPYATGDDYLPLQNNAGLSRPE